MAGDAELTVLQTKFIEHGAIQCGYCTPGMLLSAKALLIASPDPTEAEIRTALAGNLCRCTGYTAIVEAVDGRCSGGGGACRRLSSSPRPSSAICRPPSPAWTRSRLLAGGTDLVNAMRRREYRPDLIVDLSSVRGLAAVRLKTVCCGSAPWRRSRNFRRTRS